MIDLVNQLVKAEQCLPGDDPRVRAARGVIRALRLAVQSGVEDHLWELFKPFFEQIRLRRGADNLGQTYIAERWASQSEEIARIELDGAVFILSVRGRILSSHLVTDQAQTEEE